MKYLLTPLLLVFLIISCDKTGVAKGTPNCVEDKIVEFNAAAQCDNGVVVKKYSFQGEFVYAFEQGDCGADLTTEIIDEDCNTLGYLGGITGNTKINGVEFSNAVFIENTWTKP